VALAEEAVTNENRNKNTLLKYSDNQLINGQAKDQDNTFITVN
jgi:hypothetical protein